MTTVSANELLNMANPERHTREPTPVPPVGTDFDLPSRGNEQAGSTTPAPKPNEKDKQHAPRKVRVRENETAEEGPPPQPKVRKVKPGSTHQQVRNTPLGAASSGSQNRARRVMEAFAKECDNSLHFQPKHGRPSVPRPGTVSSLIQQEYQRAVGCNPPPPTGGQDGVGVGRGPTRAGPAHVPAKNAKRVLDPDALVIDREFQETVSKALVRSGGRVLRLPESETQNSPGLHKLVERNLRWFDEAHDGFKLMGLLLAKKLNALAEETIERYMPTFKNEDAIGK